MKRFLKYAAVSALAIIGILVVISNSKNHSDNTAVPGSSITKQAGAHKPKQACLIFSLDDAKQVLGDSAKGGETGSNTSSDDLEVSTCSYTQIGSSGVAISSTESATLLARAPKTSDGIVSNQNQFGRLKPTEVEDIDGYGDKAYWDARYGQLNIFKNNTWYILSNGQITPSSRTLGQTEQLADILINKM